MFHNHLVMQSGAYQNGTWVVGVAKAGKEEGCEMIGGSCIIAPSGEIVAACSTKGDELAIARCDLDLCLSYKKTTFNFDRHRRPEAYGLITQRRGAMEPAPGRRSSPSPRRAPARTAPGPSARPGRTFPSHTKTCGRHACLQGACGLKIQTPRWKHGSVNQARRGFPGCRGASPAAERDNALYRKVAWRLLPFLMVCYIAAFLDRVNVGFAKLQMLDDLKFSEAVYGLGAGIFFIGYFLFEVPSNVLMHRIGAGRRWRAS